MTSVQPTRGNIVCASEKCTKLVRNAWACTDPVHGEGAPSDRELFCSRQCRDAHVAEAHGVEVTK